MFPPSLSFCVSSPHADCTTVFLLHKVPVLSDPWPAYLLGCSETVMGCPASLLCPLLPFPTLCSTAANRVTTTATRVTSPVSITSYHHLPRSSQVTGHLGSLLAAAQITHIEQKFLSVFAAFQRCESRDIHEVVQDLVYLPLSSVGGIVLSRGNRCSKFSQ